MDSRLPIAFTRRRSADRDQGHVGMLLAESSYQVAEKSCRNRRENADAQVTILAATCCPSNLHSMVELSECGTCAIEKPGKSQRLVKQSHDIQPTCDLRASSILQPKPGAPA